MEQEPNPTGAAEEVHCAECNTLLAQGQDREITNDGVFCRPCFNNLTAQVQQAVADQGSNVNYPLALVGGLLGGALGVIAWWGFTVLTKIAFGLVAVVIGVTVGKGITLLAGGKRAQGLQIMSVIISSIAFFYASYLVNRTFLVQAYAEQGEQVVLPWLPSLELWLNVSRLSFGFMDFIFLAIVIYQAWKIPAPFKLEA